MSNNCWNTPFSSANGQLLIAQDSGRPAWATVTGGTGATVTDGAGSITIDLDAATSDWELISSATASTSSEITFTGLSSTYDTYVVVINDLQPVTDGSILYLRTSTNAGVSYDSGASDYAWASYGVNDGAKDSEGSSGDDHISLAGDQSSEELGNQATETLAGMLWIYDPSGTQYTKVFFDWNYTDLVDDQNSVTGMGARLSAADVDAIQFTMDSGNISSGNFRLYGLRA